MTQTWFKFARIAALAASLAVATNGVVAQSTPTNEPLTPESKTKVLASVERLLTERAFVPGADFSKWPTMIASYKEQLDGAKSDAEFSNVVNTALQKFGFSHIMLFPPAVSQQRVTQTRAGIGIRIQVEENGLRVTDIFPDGPAAKAGIAPGDLVIECDGKPVRSVTDVSGEKGQKSTIVVDRDGAKKSFEIVRADYSTVIPETIEWDGEIAIVKVPTFDIGYSRTNIDKLLGEARKAKGIVLDLRSNGGGRVINLQHLAGHFLDAQAEPMGTFVGRQNLVAYEKETGKTGATIREIAEFTKAKVRAASIDGGPYRGPVAVLINGGSGSASEMMAASLREQRGAYLVGSRSAGAVLASIMAPIMEVKGYTLQIPLLDYVTIKGHRLEGNGLVPDAEAPIARFGQPDEAVGKAKVWLKSKVN